MPLFVGSTVLDVRDLDRAVAFWCAALGYVARDGQTDADFAVLADPRRRWSNVSLQRTDEAKRGVNRVHLDLYAEDREREVARLLALGARRADWAYEEPNPDFVVLLDPDGNEFCVVQSAWTQEGPARPTS